MTSINDAFISFSCADACVSSGTGAGREITFPHFFVTRRHFSMFSPPSVSSTKSISDTSVSKAVSR